MIHLIMIQTIGYFLHSIVTHLFICLFFCSFLHSFKITNTQIITYKQNSTMTSTNNVYHLCSKLLLSGMMPRLCQSKTRQEIVPPKTRAHTVYKRPSQLLGNHSFWWYDCKVFIQSIKSKYSFKVFSQGIHLKYSIKVFIQIIQSMPMLYVYPFKDGLSLKLQKYIFICTS